VIVSFRPDPMGMVHADPVSAKTRKEMFHSMQDNGYAGPECDALVYCNLWDLQDILAPRHIKDLDNGWDVRVRMSKDFFRDLCGYN